MIQFQVVIRAASLCAALLAPPAFAIPAAVQDFEDGTAEGWTFGGGPSGLPSTPQTVVSGGAGGLSDEYMRVTSTGGSGPGSNLSAINADVWGGNYTDAGLTTIGMDLLNLGATDLYIRLLLLDLSDPLTAVYAITYAVFLPSGGAWTAASFSVAGADLIALEGDVSALLQSVTQIRIVGSSDPNWLFSPGQQPPVVAVLGVDNIMPNVFGDDGGNNQVPEPSTSWLVAIGMLAALRRVRAAKRTSVIRASAGIEQ